MQYKVTLKVKKAGEINPSLDTLTKNEIIKILKDKGIEFNPKVKKNELIALLGGD